MRLVVGVRVLLIAVALVLGSLAFGAAKALVVMNGGTAGPGLAKSWKSAGKGKMEFVLDTSEDIGGKKLSPDMVKSSLEGKLGASHGVKVQAKGKSAVVVSYTGEEKAFLEEVAKTRIKAGGTELALESSSSDAGIRAKTSDRQPVEGEVKGVVTVVKGTMATVRVMAVGGNVAGGKIKESSVVKINVPSGTTVATEETVFFKPSSSAGNVWNVSVLTKE